MKKKWYFIGVLIVAFLIGSCALLPAEENSPVEEPILMASETPSITSPPLVTFTPTSTNEPVIKNTATPEPTEVVETEDPISQEASETISINNVTQLEMSILVEQEIVKDIAWMALPDASVALLSSDELSIIDSTNAIRINQITIPEEYDLFDISPVGNLIACTDDYERILLLSATTLEQISVIYPETFVANAHFNLDGTKLLISSMEEMIAIEADTMTGEILKIHTGFSTAAPVYDVVYSRNTNDLIWFARGRIQIQNPINDYLSTDFQHEDWVNAFSISPDGEFLAVATAKTLDNDYSAGVQLWHIATGEALDFLRTDNMSSALFYSNDGSLLIGTDGILLKFWDAYTGEMVHESAGHVDSIYKASLAPNGDAILTASYDGQTILWKLP